MVSERALHAASAEGRRKPGGEWAWKPGQTCPVTDAPIGDDEEDVIKINGTYPHDDMAGREARGSGSGSG